MVVQSCAAHMSCYGMTGSCTCMAMQPWDCSTATVSMVMTAAHPPYINCCCLFKTQGEHQPHVGRLRAIRIVAQGGVGHKRRHRLRNRCVYVGVNCTWDGVETISTSVALHLQTVAVREHTAAGSSSTFILGRLCTLLCVFCPHRADISILACLPVCVAVCLPASSACHRLLRKHRGIICLAQHPGHPKHSDGPHPQHAALHAAR